MTSLIAFPFCATKIFTYKKQMDRNIKIKNFCYYLGFYVVFTS